MLYITLKERNTKRFVQNWQSKVGTLTVYMLISCILMPGNCFRSGKSCEMYDIFTKFSSSEVSFQHF
jgi:hypothetical protein